MARTFIKTAWAATLALLLTLPAYSQPDGSVDLTQFFARQTSALADDAEELEAVAGHAAAAPQVPGLVSYADVKPREVGDIETFSSFNIVRNAHERVSARLEKIGAHCYIYVQQGRNVSQQNINRIAETFDKRIYAEARSMFGSEKSPGIDNDQRITLLLLDIRDYYDPERGVKGFTAGYFNAGDCYSRAKFPESNMREMLYLDVYPGDPSTDKFLSVIAHEFQHMIHWSYDSKEFTWVNESLSQLAPFLCGLGHPSQVEAFMRNPDNNMLAWSDDDMIANYGQVYFWAQYISTRIASTDERRRAFIRRMVSQKSQGLSGLNAAIEKQGIKNNVRNLFRSFCVANYLNDDRIERGIYSYEKSLSRFLLKPDIKVAGIPYEGKGSVKCWSARAIQINPAAFRGSDARFAFAGQKISAAGYSNDFDVAVIGYSSDGKYEPVVSWLNVKDYKAMDVVKVTAEHDRLMMVVVNRGPEVMKAEQAFARNASPALFSFRVSKVGTQTGPAPRVASRTTGNRSAERTRVARASGSSSSRTSRSRARSILEEIASSIGLDESAGVLLGDPDENNRSAAEISYDFAFQKISSGENELVDAIRAALAEGQAELVVDFAAYYRDQNTAGKEKLHILKNRIRDMLKFEEMQGNTQATELLTLIEP